MDSNDKQLLADVNEILSIEPGACEFVLQYQDYVHMIDDIIDDKITDPDTILLAFGKSRALFSNVFYQKYIQQLSLLELLINNEYADVVEWEQSSEEWKRRHADALRHCGYNMLFACIAICGGPEVLRKVSGRFRENAHQIHLKDYEFYK
jgi:hypothetical protein